MNKNQNLYFYKVLTEGGDFLPVGDAVCVSWARNSHRSNWFDLV